MRRACTPVAHRALARTSGYATAAVRRHQSSRAAAAVAAPSAPSPDAPRPLRIRSRGYGPSSDILRGIPADVALHVEATLHPEDAEVQRAVLALAMPQLAEIRVTPVRPHGTYQSRTPRRTGAAFADDIISSAEREVMEEFLQQQLTVVANLVVQEVEQRTGLQLDAQHAAYTENMKSFSEIVLNTIHDELRQLRIVGGRQKSPESGAHSAAAAAAAAATAAAGAASASPSPMDVEEVARLVSARVAEHLAAASQSATAPPPTASSAGADVAAHLARLEASAEAHLAQLQQRVTAVLERRGAEAPAPASAELHASILQAVHTASAEQQANLSSLITDLLAEQRPETHSGDGRGATVDVRAIEESVESAVQSATDELRRAIVSEVKKLSKAKGGGSGGGGAADGVADGVGDLAADVEKVFDAVQSTQNRLAAVDETVGDVFKEQAATREALRAMEEVLQRQLQELRAAIADTAAAVGAAAPPPAGAASSATEDKVAAALEQLRLDVSSTGAMFAVQHEATQSQLMTVAQVVSESVTAAIQHRTEEAVHSAVAAVQEQLSALREATAAAASAAATPAPAPPPLPPPPPPLSQEMLADAVEAVLSPRWAELSVQVERVNSTSQIAIEGQLLRIADSVSTAVAATVQAQLAEVHAAVTAASEAAARHAEAERARDEQRSAGSTSNSAAAAAATAAADALLESTTRELSVMRGELLQALETHASARPEVNLAPMYKYIDSVLTFMKDELSLQETNLTAKLTSMADTVATAVREQQQHAVTAAEAAAAAASEAATSAAAAAAAAVSHTTAPAEERQARQAEPADLSAPASPSPSPPLPDVSALLAPLGASLEAHAAALHRLETRLDEVGRTADAASVLARLQEATDHFSSAATAVAAAQSAERDALQALLESRLASLAQSLEGRDAALLEAVRGAATGEEVREQLGRMQEALHSASQTGREELSATLRDVVSGTERELGQRSDAILARLSDMHDSMQAHHAAVQRLQPSPALVGLSAEQQQAQARIRSATRDRIERVTQLVADAAAAPAGKGTRAATKAVQAELAALRQLHEEEAASLLEGTAGAAPVTVQSVVQAEVLRLQEEVRSGTEGLQAQSVALQREVAAAVQSLMAKMEDVGGNVGELPALTDVQQLLDTTVARLTTERAQESERATALVEAATVRSAAELAAAVQAALSSSVAAAEERVIPAYHAQVESTLLSRLATHSSAIESVAARMADTTATALLAVERLARDMAAQHTSTAPEPAAARDGQWLHVHGAAPPAHVPLWWLLANPLLVCVAVVLCVYYVCACLLLAFVPPPLRGDDGAEPSTSDGPTSASSREVVGRRGGRYVDRFM
ncbi:hypothetical protein NESM_000607600 [Novymonas esmeraldas]|uniref:Uncharacterized protein n=1 Tax=Novymonas esmeraldas TaxID=1808958 RepID=A0AAW0EUD7_9TRYP